MILIFLDRRCFFLAGKGKSHPNSQMSRFEEISSLFAAIVSNVRAQDPTARSKDQNVDISISNLNRSLNLCDTSRVRILDTALSLMCFTAPQVCDSIIEQTLGTIITVISASIECKVLRIDGNLVMRAGGSISKTNCEIVMEGCACILQKMEGLKGDLCDMLLYAVIRLAALAPGLQNTLPSTPIREMKFHNAKDFALPGLLGHVPKEFNIKNGEVPLRLLLWHLDPVILKQDVSQILQEVIKRPFLHLGMEIIKRGEWRSKVVCLVFSPLIFVETRALLHNWFLETGLPSVMELQTEFVVQVLDILSRPMWWGISMEIGSELPFSHAYFPYEHHLFRNLAGPMSQEYFQHLLTEVCGSVSPSGGHLHPSSNKAATKMNMIDHKSMWAMVMNFPGWFFYASVLLFYNNIHAADSFPSVFIRAGRPFLLHDVEVSCSVGAARFIAWILNPFTKSYQDQLVGYLTKVSELWTLRLYSPNKCNGVKASHKMENQRTKLLDELGMTSLDHDSLSVALWLKEFKETYIKYFGTKAGPMTPNAKGFGIQHGRLFRRIPLGILIAHSIYLSAAGCELLLHYAITGITEKFSEAQDSGRDYKRRKYEGEWLMRTEEYNTTEAVAGCRIVFDVTDATETISSSLFETEEEEVDFVCQVKLKTGDYLFKCMKRLLLLLQLEFDGNGLLMQRDLLSRVIRWRNQGKDVFQKNKDLDFLCNSLNV